MSLDVTYFSFSPTRADERWKGFGPHITGLRVKYQQWLESGNIDILERTDWKEIISTFTPEERFFFEEGSDYLFAGTVYDESHLIDTLKQLDLKYGSVSAGQFDEGSSERDALRSLAEAAELPLEEDMLSKEGWVYLFTHLTNEVIQKAGNSISKKNKWNLKEESIPLLMDYLTYVRPIAKDLKATPDALFVPMYNGEIEAIEGAGEILNQRALSHMQMYKGLLPPVL